MKKITLIVPVYNEALSIDAFCDAFRRVISENIGVKFKLLFVDDGSKDLSYAKICHISKSYPNIGCLKLTRNFGKEAAIFAGLSAADGDAAIIIDCDLQHPPELIKEFITQWDAGYLVVCGVRLTTEKESILRKIGSILFYKIMNLASNISLQQGVTDFCLIDRKVINEIIKLTEANRLFRGILHWVGFKTAYIEFHAPIRSGGSSSFDFSGLVNLGLNGITSFTLFPLKIIGFFGVALSFASGILFIIMLIDKFILEYKHFAPISYVIVINTFFMGLLGMSMGLMAIYIGNIYTDVRRRPLFIVENQI